MKTLLVQFLLFISTVSIANADSNKYFCNGEVNQFFITFDTKQKTVMVKDGKYLKYWTKPNYRFWHTAKEYMVYEYTFKISYNKLSGNLEIKGHHLVTSENKWYYYKCEISQ